MAYSRAGAHKAYDEPGSSCAKKEERAQEHPSHVRDICTRLKSGQSWGNFTNKISDDRNALYNKIKESILI